MSKVKRWYIAAAVAGAALGASAGGAVLEGAIGIWHA